MCNLFELTFSLFDNGLYFVHSEVLFQSQSVKGIY